MEMSFSNIFFKEAQIFMWSFYHFQAIKQCFLDLMIVGVLDVEVDKNHFLSQEKVFVQLLDNFCETSVKSLYF